MALKDYLRRTAEFIIHGVPVKHITAKVTCTQPSERLAGRRIIITGGGRGLGLAMAKRFVAEGAKVLIAGRNEATLKESAQAIGCLYLKLDLRQVETFDAFMQHAFDMLGGADCLVNNAGVSHHEGDISRVTVEDFDTQINTNLRGAYFLTQKFLARYVPTDEKSGHILFISSERGMMADDLPYGLTKAAVNSLVQALAVTLVGKNIRVNAVAPGVTTSDMTRVKADGDLFRASQTTERVYLPEEVAETACFLLSEASNVLNGQILVCNEGKSINFRR